MIIYMALKTAVAQRWRVLRQRSRMLFLRPRTTCVFMLVSTNCRAAERPLTEAEFTLAAFCVSLITLAVVVGLLLRTRYELRTLNRILQNQSETELPNLPEFPLNLQRSRTLYPLLHTLQSLCEMQRHRVEALQEQNHLLISEQHRTADANEQLEQGIAERSRELEAKTRQVTETLNDLRMTQQQLLDLERQTMVGELVAGLAHEINTPLAIGAATLDNLIRELEPTRGHIPETESECNAMLDHIIDAVSLAQNNTERAADIVARFKEVSVDQASGQERKFEIGNYLHSIITSLRPHYRYRPIEIDIHCPDPIYITGAPGIYAQIVTNLMINALDHAFDRDQQGRISITATRAGNRLCLCFADNGKGMDQATLEKVFQPFFTTRRNDGGSGLGAHIVYDLVANRLQGNIRIQSEPGCGTAYQMLIPCEISGPDAYNACSPFEEFCKCSK